MGCMFCIGIIMYHSCEKLGPILQTGINFNPSMDKELFL